ncbi:AMP-binding enzyme [Blastomyces dermatitidis ATCC 18188]|uniref:AMP-binding enzyme n=1 Tax=Ajellomyces dermatitidis (strain ATCC 18188 / CBS 674.68) TaxID=653446 RepID=F2TQN5_AJEDA|nr:AMP-binding enzyme [Blastomyces dermatitidis ATCC 18188]EQL32159.1 hypothetical protein BDFG_05640 [Blastomyces dermatitidis ATCC 26199]
MVPDVFPLPGVVHGNRVVATIIETRAKAGANTQPWVSVPIDDNDISAGYRDVSFQQLNNAANHAARWLSQALPATSEPFQYFAYAGPKDLRYPCLAVAAAKLQKVMVLPSPLLTPGAQLRVQEKTNCKLCLRPSEMAGPASNILRNAPHVEQITASGIEEFFRDDEADPMVYSKTWDEGKEDPWLVFHTSGTTGHPKPVTYSQQMMATPNTAASLPDFKPSQIHQSAQARYYTPLPALHTQFIGMFVTLGLTTGHHTTCVVGPPIPPNPKLLINIIRYRKVAGVLLNPVLIDALCLSPEGLQALCTCGNVSFQRDIGAEFHHRMKGIHELVFVRWPEFRLQPIFQLYPNLQTFETNDLFIEHPEHKGLWKIIGRKDDYVYLVHGDGIHAALLEEEIVAHPSVKAAVIGGFGRPVPVLLVELVPAAEADDVDALKRSLEPYIEKANVHCHDVVKLSSERLIVAKKEKPFVTTLKGNALRLQTLELYEEEIPALFE